MAIPNADPRGLVATGQDNSGYAAILDRPRFDPVAFMSGITQRKAQQVILDRKEGMEKAAARRKALSGLIPTNPSQKFLPEYSQRIDQATKLLAEIEAQGGQVENTPEFMKIQADLNALETEDKAYQALVKAKMADFAKNIDKYDPEEIMAWKQGLDEQKTIGEAFAYVNDPAKSPQTAFRPLDIIPTKLPQGIPSDADLGMFADSFLLGDQTGEVQRAFEQGKLPDKLTGKPLWTDYDGMHKYYVDYLESMTRNQQPKAVRPAKAPTSGASGGSYTTTTKYIVQPTNVKGGKNYDTVTVSYPSGINDPMLETVMPYDGKGVKKGEAVAGRIDAYTVNSDGSINLRLQNKGRFGQEVTEIVGIQPGSEIWSKLTATFGKDPKEMADEAWASRQMKQEQKVDNEFEQFKRK